VRVGYVEKVEYWAALWGTAVTAITGLILWFENFTLTWLPGWVPEAATVLHFLEAILATLAILIWHLYSVMMDPAVYPMDMTWLTGKPPFARAEERGEVIHTDEVDEQAP
jgi:cytochrome b subunit of formate dehydrogenase